LMGWYENWRKWGMYLNLKGILSQLVLWKYWVLR